jgi:hypothetical protein
MDPEELGRLGEVWQAEACEREMALHGEELGELRQLSEDDFVARYDACLRAARKARPPEVSRDFLERAQAYAAELVRREAQIRPTGWKR